MFLLWLLCGGKGVSLRGSMGEGMGGRKGVGALRSILGTGTPMPMVLLMLCGCGYWGFEDGMELGGN